MNKKHFNEEQLQQSALSDSTLDVTDHLSSCPDCRFQIEIYRTIHLGIRESVEPKLDLEISELLLCQIGKIKSVESSIREYLYPILFVSLLLLAIALFTFWKTIVYILTGINPDYLVFGLLFMLGISAMQFVGFYRVASEKLNALK